MNCPADDSCFYYVACVDRAKHSPAMSQTINQTLIHNGPCTMGKVREPEPVREPWKTSPHLTANQVMSFPARMRNGRLSFIREIEGMLKKSCK